jgi:uncharacterized protein YcfJ
MTRFGALGLSTLITIGTLGSSVAYADEATRAAAAGALGSVLGATVGRQVAGEQGAMIGAGIGAGAAAGAASNRDQRKEAAIGGALGAAAGYSVGNNTGYANGGTIGAAVGAAGGTALGHKISDDRAAEKRERAIQAEADRRAAERRQPTYVLNSAVSIVKPNVKNYVPTHAPSMIAAITKAIINQPKRMDTSMIIVMGLASMPMYWAYKPVQVCTFAKLASKIRGKSPPYVELYWVTGCRSSTCSSTQRKLDASAGGFSTLYSAIRKV